MTGDKRKIKRPHKLCWDSCLFIAWLMNEARAKKEMDELARQQTFFDSGRIHLCTSTIAIVEVLESTLPAGTPERWQKVLQRQNFHLDQVTLRISRKAHAIRDYFRNLPDGNGTFSTPDAIFMATAIEAGCDYFYTFDGSDGQKKKRNSRTILPFAQIIKAQFGLEVLRPWLDPDPNKNLEFPFEEEKEDEAEEV